MTLPTEPYLDQIRRWPASGRHVLAQFDANKAIVYQAYKPAIAEFAVQHQRFGGEFSLNRMSWIKTNFLWMMYRSGWGTKEGQEVTLAIHLRRDAFEQILRQAVHSSFVSAIYGSQEIWKSRLAESAVRLQWDPDHDPRGIEQKRRAIQLGLSGETLRQYVQEWIVGIDDISGFVSEQREHACTAGLSRLMTPREEVYSVSDKLAMKLGIG
jgi:hypothetical protein